MESPYATQVEAAKYVRRPVETLRQWRHRGFGPPSFRIGARVLYRWDELKAWVAEQEDATRVSGGDAA